jgi:6-phosphogluconolactonase
MQRLQTTLGAFTIAMSLACAANGADADSADAGVDLSKETLAYVGTYTGKDSKGIYLFRLETKNPDVSQNVMLVPLGLAAEIRSPSFLALDPKRRLLFAVNEMNQFDGQPGGAASAFSIDPATGKLTLINQQSTKGSGPCHLVLDDTGRNLIVANYGSGSVAVIPVAEDGRLSAASSFVQHEGSSVNPSRQEGPHAHCVTMSPDNKFAFVCDLGLDQILSYRFDAENGKLTPNEPAFASSKPGAGPRHIEFRPDGKFAYAINELNSTVTTYAYDPEKGTLTEVQTVSSLPEYFDGPNTGAEIAVHPSGKYVYVSNRGHESVVLFEIDRDKGTLTYVEEQSTGGKTPRHFGIQPSGKHMAIANQNSGTLLLCRIDDGNGRLKPSGVFAEVPSPACVVFLPPTESGGTN